MRLATPKDFERVFSIMEQSFPRDEYRSREGQRALFDDDDYALYVHENEAGEIVGFVSVWQIADDLFIEHLAVEESCRSAGIGGKMLEELRTLYSLPLCLEVELPANELCRRRIAFYERHGFHYNDYPYEQPAFSSDRSAVPLRIMSTRPPLSAEEFALLKKKIYRRIYKKF